MDGYMDFCCSFTQKLPDRQIWMKFRTQIAYNKYIFSFFLNEPEYFRVYIITSSGLPNSLPLRSTSSRTMSADDPYPHDNQYCQRKRRLQKHFHVK